MKRLLSEEEDVKSLKRDISLLDIRTTLLDQISISEPVQKSNNYIGHRDACTIFCENVAKFGDRADINKLLELTVEGVDTLSYVEEKERKKFNVSQVFKVMISIATYIFFFIFQVTLQRMPCFNQFSEEVFLKMKPESDDVESSDESDTSN